MDQVPADGVRRLVFFMENRLAQLRWTRDDLVAAGGPVPSTLRKAGRRGGRPAQRTLARLDFALGWQEGSACAILSGGSPAVRVSEQMDSCSIAIDRALRHAECVGTAHCAEALRKFLLTVAQQLGDFYTDPAPSDRELLSASAS